MADTRLHQVIQQLCRTAGSANAASGSDAQLLERFVAARDESAFELLVWRHQRMVLSVCQRVLRDRHEAEDAFQATFLALARKAGSIGKSAALGSWLYQVAYRVALRASTRGKQRTQHEKQGLELATTAGEPEAEAGWRDLEPLLDRELNHLPEKYRAPVVLCYLQGKSYDEAAQQLGCPKGTVSTRLTYARDLLRKRLSQRGVCLSAATFVSLLAAQSASAALPAALVSSTAKAAVLYAGGNALAAGLVAPQVVALAEEVLHTLVLVKLKLVAAVVLAVGIVGSGLGAATYRLQAERPAPASSAVAPRPTAVAETKALVDRVPDGLRGFQGNLIGQLVSRAPDRGTLLLEVRQVKDVWKSSRAENPNSAIGKTLLIDGVFGKFSDVLPSLKPGDGIQINARHLKGDSLSFLGEELRKVPLPDAPAK